MRIAKHIRGNLIECDDITPLGGLYRCFICGEPVHPCNDLKKEDGRKKEYYFAHYRNTCTGSVETYFHRIAKQIIAESSVIMLPDRKMEYTTVEVECNMLHPALRPDVLLDSKVIVEICCTNAKTEKQVSIFRELNLTAIEINLGALTMDSSLEEITRAVLNDTENRNYLSKKVDPVHENNQPANAIIGFILFIIAWIGIKKLMHYFFPQRKWNSASRRFKKKKSYHISY